MKKFLTIVALLVCLLTVAGCSGGGNGVVPPVEENVERIVGTWLNVDQNTDHITKIYITEVGSYLSIEEWGKCYPDDCYWEKRLVKKNEIIDGILEVSWLYEDEEVFQEIVLLDDPNGKLKVTTVYKYPSSGHEWSAVDIMFKPPLLQ